MISTTDLAKLEQLVSRLPFQLDDLFRANATFKEWVKHGRSEDQNVIDLWTYCFVWRNLLVKFSRNADLNASDFDMLVASVFERIIERRYTVRDETRYTNWVSVICRNYFVNYLRRLKKSLPVDDPSTVAVIDEPAVFEDDIVILRQVVNSAIARLPRYLQQVVQMRLMEQMSYEDIAGQLNKKIEVVRSYFNKAMKKLREDKVLQKQIKRDFREDIQNEGMR